MSPKYTFRNIRRNVASLSLLYLANLVSTYFKVKSVKMRDCCTPANYNTRLFVVVLWREWMHAGLENFAPIPFLNESGPVSGRTTPKANYALMGLGDGEGAPG